MEVLFNDINVNVVIEKKRNRNMYFRFKNPYTLYVTCPKLSSNTLILDYIRKNHNALSKMHLKTLSMEESNEFFCFKGKRYIRVFDETKTCVTFDDDFVYSKDEKMLDKYVKNYTKEYFEQEVNYIKNYFNDIPEFSLRIRSMKTRWGVCNRSLNIVTLNSELVKRTKEELDYVIVHELCHFYEANHSKNFWNHVQYFMPNYKTLRNKLKEAI